MLCYAILYDTIRLPPRPSAEPAGRAGGAKLLRLLLLIIMMIITIIIIIRSSSSSSSSRSSSSSKTTNNNDDNHDKYGPSAEPQGAWVGEFHLGVSKTGFSKTGFMDVYSCSSVLLLTLSIFILCLGNDAKLQTIMTIHESGST